MRKFMDEGTSLAEEHSANEPERLAIFGATQVPILLPIVSVDSAANLLTGRKL